MHLDTIKIVASFISYTQAIKPLFPEFNKFSTNNIALPTISTKQGSASSDNDMWNHDSQLQIKTSPTIFFSRRSVQPKKFKKKYARYRSQELDVLTRRH
jgi:hypothetical protein